MKTPTSFERQLLDGGRDFWVGVLPGPLVFSATQFDELWKMHPEGYHVIKIHGRLVNTPRWQQAYGMDYHYTGRVNKALPIPPLLEPSLAWARNEIDDCLNGLLLNWYDGDLNHYIGRHRDSIKNMIVGTPIVTISFGEERIFRVRSYGKDKDESKKFDFPARNGSVFIMPYETNLALTHEVPKSSTSRGKRISVTIRAFET
jgi:alkylated DNA repair dioxygenase AlkB